MTGASMASVAYGKSLFDLELTSSHNRQPSAADRALARKGGASRVAGELAGTVIQRPRFDGGRSRPTLVPSRSFSANDISGMSASFGQSAMESFLLYVARSLSMDIGELWSLDLASSFRMTNMYIAPDFYERHSARILYPDSDPRANPSRQHRFSRGLCMRAVMRGEPLWCDVSSPESAPHPAASLAAAPAAEDSAPVELPLRTAVVIPFITSTSDRPEGTSSTTAVLVLYSQRYRPLPSHQVMHTLSAFTRVVATQKSMAHFLRTLSARLETFDMPAGETHSVADRLGLTSSASTPACLHELDLAPPDRTARQRSFGAESEAPVPTPSVAPPAPSLRGHAGSTFAQRRMRQMLAEHPDPQ